MKRKYERMTYQEILDAATATCFDAADKYNSLKPTPAYKLKGALKYHAPADDFWCGFVAHLVNVEGWTLAEAEDAVASTWIRHLWDNGGTEVVKLRQIGRGFARRLLKEGMRRLK